MAFSLPLFYFGALCIGLVLIVIGYGYFKGWFSKKKQYEQKTVPASVGNAMINSGEAKFVSALPDGQLIIKQEVEPPVKEKKVEEAPIEEVSGSVPYEIVEQKDDRTMIVKRGRIQVQKGRFRNGQEFIAWRKRLYFPNHIMKETTTTKGLMGKVIIKVRYFIRWNKYYSEALDLIHTNEPEYSEELEATNMIDMMAQLRDAAITLAGLAIDRPMMFLLILAMVFGIPIGLSFNSIFNWVPSTVVHWVPRS